MMMMMNKMKRDWKTHKKHNPLLTNAHSDEQFILLSLSQKGQIANKYNESKRSIGPQQTKRISQKHKRYPIYSFL